VLKKMRFLFKGKVKGLATVLEHIVDGIPCLTNSSSTSNTNTLTPYQRIDKEWSYIVKNLWYLQTQIHFLVGSCSKADTQPLLYLSICATSVPSFHLLDISVINCKIDCYQKILTCCYSLPKITSSNIFMIFKNR